MRRPVSGTILSGFHSQSKLIDVSEKLQKEKRPEAQVQA